MEFRKRHYAKTVSHLSMMELGHSLRVIRTVAGLTQAELSRVSGLSRQELSYLECGHQVPTLDTLQRWLAGVSQSLEKRPLNKYLAKTKAKVEEAIREL